MIWIAKWGFGGGISGIQWLKRARKRKLGYILKTALGRILINLQGEFAWSSLDHYK
jgi:hypothetical protein